MVATETKSQKKTGKDGRTRVKKKEKRDILEGCVHIHASFNNTIISITDSQGNKLCSGSAGEVGFKGARKSTPYAAQVAAEKAAKIAQEHGMKKVSVFVKGPGPGRESAIRALTGLGLDIQAMSDITGTPFNGCRPPKRRRV